MKKSKGLRRQWMGQVPSRCTGYWLNTQPMQGQVFLDPWSDSLDGPGVRSSVDPGADSSAEPWVRAPARRGAKLPVGGAGGETLVEPCRG